MPDLMTLPEYANSLDTDSVERPLVESFAASSDIMAILPIDGMNGPVYEYHREASLPESMAFRGVNEPGTSGTGRLEPFQESAYILDHDIDIDKSIERRYGPDRRAREQKLGAAKAGRLWATTFMSGDTTTQPREFNGIQKRCSMHSSDRVLTNSASSGGAALSLGNLDKAINMVNGATHIIAPRLIKPLLIAAARNTAIAGFVMQAWNDVGAAKLSYAGLPFLFGYEREIEGDLLDFTEVGSGGGSAVTCSLYPVRIGEEGVFGIQLQGMQFEDVGLLPDRITLRTHLSWDTGLVDVHPYCLARLTSITNAAIVA